ncbi:DUF5753 domain-containing protein [Streptomyces sp. NPDC051644]
MKWRIFSGSSRAVVSASSSAPGYDEVEALVTARTRRQEVLQRPDPPRMCVIEGEAALRLHVGGAQVMRKQLEHLATMTEHPSVEVQAIPDRAGAHAGPVGSFVLFGFPDPSFSEAVCVEHRTGTLSMETPEETGEYTLIFDSLRSIALSPRRQPRRDRASAKGPVAAGNSET